MNNISAEYMSRAETWLLLTTLIYFLMNGAQIFETVVIVPKQHRLLNHSNSLKKIRT